MNMVTITLILGSLAVIMLGFLLFQTLRAPRSTIPLPHDFHNRLAQLEADHAATRRQLGELERSTELGFKSVTQRIVQARKRSRSEEDEELAEIGQQALTAALSSSGSAPAQPEVPQIPRNGGTRPYTLQKQR